MIVLDTSVLSLAFRRERRGSEPEPAAVALGRLIVADVPLAVPGIVLQELLSGVRSPSQFRQLQGLLAGFPALVASESDHVRAARINNACRARGVACTAVDALIAALAIASDSSLFTADQDFERIATCCELRLLRRPT